MQRRSLLELKVTTLLFVLKTIHTYTYCFLIQWRMMQSCLQKGVNVRTAQRELHKDVEAVIFISLSVIPWCSLSRESPYSWYRKTLNGVLKGLAERFSDTHQQ